LTKFLPSRPNSFLILFLVLGLIEVGVFSEVQSRGREFSGDSGEDVVCVRGEFGLYGWSWAVGPGLMGLGQLFSVGSRGEMLVRQILRRRAWTIGLS
jgi:hypothetical protein